MARQILLIDAVASRYHCLPSSVISQADTFDVFIINSALEIQHRQREKEEAKQSGKPPPPPKLSEQQMKSMVASVRR